MKRNPLEIDVSFLFAGLGGILGWFFGDLDGFFYMLLAFVIVDYITGVLRAFATRRLSSRIGARGIAKKITIFLLVGLSNIIDKYLLYDSEALRLAVIFFYTSNEGISLLENAVVLGLPVPGRLRDALVNLAQKKAL
jgi:toxin secretion/phage lysis holin